MNIINQDFFNASNDALDILSLPKMSFDEKESFIKHTEKTHGLKETVKLLFNYFQDSMYKDGSVLTLSNKMGGGKTHIMLYVSILLENDVLRKKYYPELTLTETIKVLSFSGRNSDQCIWAELGKQTNRIDALELLQDVDVAPGLETWSNSLGTVPTLVIIDELPPYLYNCTDNKRKKVVTAISNLISASDKNPNLFFILSDLNASNYKEIDSSINSMFASSLENLKSENNRTSKSITPIKADGTESFSILKKKAFVDIEIMPTELIDKRDAFINEAIQLKFLPNYTDKLKNAIIDSYPFSYFDKELHLRYKNNSSAQETRGLIKLTRFVLKNYTSGLITCSTFDYSNPDILDFITNSIRPSLANAITSDIFDNGVSLSEKRDKETGTDIASRVSKLILFSSLAEGIEPVRGLTRSEIIENLWDSNYSPSEINDTIDFLLQTSHYLYEDRNIIEYRENKNIQSSIDDYAKNLSSQEKKLLLINYLTEKVKHNPSENIEGQKNTFFNRTLFFPTPDSIDTSLSSLVFVEPEYGSEYDLNNDYLNWWTKKEDNKTRLFQNQVTFVTSTYVNYNNLLNSLSKKEAISIVIKNITPNRNNDDDELLKLQSNLQSMDLEILMSVSKAFNIVYFPEKIKSSSPFLKKIDITINHLKKDNFAWFDFHSSIIDNLITERKFIVSDVNNTKLRITKKFFINSKERKWSDIIIEMKDDPSWKFYPTGFIDFVKSSLLKEKYWEDLGNGFISCSPPKKKAFVTILKEVPLDDSSIKIELTQTNCDHILFSIDDDSFEILDKNDYFFKLSKDNYKVTFRPVALDDSFITTPDIIIRKELFVSIEKNDDFIILSSNVPNVPIYYNVSGDSAGTDGVLYTNPIPSSNVTHISAIAKLFPDHCSNEVNENLKNISSVSTVIADPFDLTDFYNNKVKVKKNFIFSNNDFYDFIFFMKDNNIFIIDRFDIEVTENNKVISFTYDLKSLVSFDDINAFEKLIVDKFSNPDIKIFFDSIIFDNTKWQSYLPDFNSLLSDSSISEISVEDISLYE